MTPSTRIEVGTRLRFDGVAYAVAGFDGSSIILRSDAGRSCRVSTVSLLDAPDFAVLGALGASADDGAPEGEPGAAAYLPPTFPDNLGEDLRSEAQEKLDHLREALYGYRSGDAASAMPGEPRPKFDPQATTITERIRTKAGELGVTERALWNRRKAYASRGLEGLVDARKLRLSNPLGNIDPKVHRAVLLVLDENAAKSNVTRERLRRLVRMRLDAEYGKGSVRMPGKTTFNKVVGEISKGRGTFGAAKHKRGIVGLPDAPYGKFQATRPGEFVLIDSTPLDAFALDAVSYRWTPLQLTLALDLYTRSIVGARFTSRDANRVDAALVLHDAITPEPMRPGWPEAARFSRRYAGIPENVVVEIGAEDAAGVPVVNPETVVVDRGKIFLSRAFEDACARLGISILLARPRRPTDKSPVERVFRTIRTQFVENLPGYKGPDVWSRGVAEAVEDAAFFFIHEIQDLFWEWVATYWQVRHHAGLELPGAPVLNLSPNDMYDEGIARAGFVYVVPHRNAYRELLPTAWVTVQRYGVETGGLRYDGEALNGYRNRTSPYGGVNRGKWPVRYDPRDLSQVFFLDPKTGEWHALHRAGSRNPQIPFDDATLSHAKSLVKERGGNPRNHRALEGVLDALVERMERQEHEGREERRLAARRAIRAEQARHDRDGAGSASSLSARAHPEFDGALPAPDASADLFDFDAEEVHAMPDLVDEGDDAFGGYSAAYDDELEHADDYDEVLSDRNGE